MAGSDKLFIHLEQHILAQIDKLHDETRIYALQLEEDNNTLERERDELKEKLESIRQIMH